MASEILRSFEEWLDSVTDEELLAALEEVDEELAAAQRAANAPPKKNGRIALRPALRARGPCGRQAVLRGGSELW